MIEERSAEIRVPDLRPLLRFRHRRVRALRDKRVERCDTAFVEEIRSDREELVRVIVARLVRDDGEDSFTRPDDIESFFDNV